MKLPAFTLIELLVVIAIIGTLSSIILSTLGNARNKAADAAAREDLINARTQAELFYVGNGNSYNTKSPPLNDVCKPGVNLEGQASINALVLAGARAVGIQQVDMVSAGSPTKAVCNTSATGNAWVAQVPLRAIPGTYFCIDSTGVGTTTSVNAVPNIGVTSCVLP